MFFIYYPFLFCAPTYDQIQIKDSGLKINKIFFISGRFCVIPLGELIKKCIIKSLRYGKRIQPQNKKRKFTVYLYSQYLGIFL